MRKWSAQDRDNMGQILRSYINTVWLPSVGTLGYNQVSRCLPLVDEVVILSTFLAILFNKVNKRLFIALEIFFATSVGSIPGSANSSNEF